MRLRRPRRVLVLGGRPLGQVAVRRGPAAPRRTDVDYVACGLAARRHRDAEWDDRVALHRARRPGVLAHPRDGRPAGGPAQPPGRRCCSTACPPGWPAPWTTAASGPTPRTPTPGSPRAVDAVVEAWAGAARPVTAVSNEVGSGVVPATPSGRRFRDELGVLNARIAARVRPGLAADRRPAAAAAMSTDVAPAGACSPRSACSPCSRCPPRRPGPGVLALAARRRRCCSRAWRSCRPWRSGAGAGRVAVPRGGPGGDRVRAAHPRPAPRRRRRPGRRPRQPAPRRAGAGDHAAARRRRVRGRGGRVHAAAAGRRAVAPCSARPPRPEGLFAVALAAVTGRVAVLPAARHPVSAGLGAGRAGGRGSAGRVAVGRGRGAAARCRRRPGAARRERPGGVWSVGAALAGLLAAAVLRRHAVRRLGGVSGDVFGALIEVRDDRRPSSSSPRAPRGGDRRCTWCGTASRSGT